VLDLGHLGLAGRDVALPGVGSCLIGDRVASGKEIQRPSDDPSASARLMRHTDRLRRIEQYQRNSNSARLWADAGDRTLQSVAYSLGRAKTLAVQAGNDTLGTEERQALAADIRAIADEMVSLSNTMVTGRAIFAGTANTANAYDAAGVYLGDGAAVTRSIDNGERVEVGLPGPQIFGVSNPGDPLNGSIFEALHQVADSVEAGNNADVRDGIEAVDAATNRVATAQGRLGAVARQLEVVADRQTSEELAVTTSMSTLQDTDVAEAIIRLRSAEASYQATLSATARGMGTSLLDFLR
ncbi:MAG: flagellar hook-associated protein FlgL, partial [Actinomycetota bacterium]